MPDHVHLLARLNKQPEVSAALRLIKANSSKWVLQTFPDFEQFAWQDGYGVVSFGTRDLPWVLNYVRDQKRHHARGGKPQDRLERITEDDTQTQPA